MSARSYAYACASESSVVKPQQLRRERLTGVLTGMDSDIAAGAPSKRRGFKRRAWTREGEEVKGLL